MAELIDLNVNKDLLQARKNLQDYFDSLPEEKLQKALDMQKEIDIKLSKAGNQYNRLTMISRMMWESFYKMKDSLEAFATPVTKSKLELIKIEKEDK